jgi:hypothetical protein
MVFCHSVLILRWVSGLFCGMLHIYVLATILRKVYCLVLPCFFAQSQSFGGIPVIIFTRAFGLGLVSFHSVNFQEREAAS